MPKAPDPKKPDDENDDEPELTPAMVQAINSAVTSQLKRSLKDVVTKGDIEALATSLTEKVTAAVKPADDKQAKGGKADETNPELKKMQERLDQLAAANKKATDDATTEKRGRLLDKAQADLHRALFVDGIGDKKQKAKAEYAEVLGGHFGQKLKVTDDGKVVMTIRKAAAKGLPEEDADVDIGEGLSHWIKSDAARAYLPAPLTGGRPAGTRTQQARTQAVTTTQTREPNEKQSVDEGVARAAEALAARGLRL